MEYKLLIVGNNQQDLIETNQVISNYFPYIHPIGVASSLEEATKLINTFRPDIVIVNPFFEGISVQRVLDNIGSKIRQIIVKTSNFNAIPEGLSMNFQIIQKPLLFEELLLAINNALLKIIKIAPNNQNSIHQMEVNNIPPNSNPTKK